jgi:hypothetical protein
LKTSKVVHKNRNTNAGIETQNSRKFQPSGAVARN